MVEYARLGNDRTGIDKVLAANGTNSVQTLDPSLYQKVIDEVRAL